MTILAKYPEGDVVEFRYDKQEAKLTGPQCTVGCWSEEMARDIVAGVAEIQEEKQEAHAIEKV